MRNDVKQPVGSWRLCPAVVVALAVLHGAGLARCSDGAGPTEDTNAPVDTTEPDTNAPVETTEPDTTEPDAAEPDTISPDAGEVDTAEPPSPSGIEAEIGPGGGELAFGGARLVVPAGALEEPTTLALVRTDDPPPAGYTAYSAIWRFEPAGLGFAVPARVELPFDPDAARPTVFWSRPDGPGYTWHPTTREGDVAVAEVTHFSDGFVGDGGLYEDHPDPSCVETRVIEGRTRTPTGLGLLVGVEDCHGSPVKGLTVDDLVIYENDDSLGVEASPVLLPKPGLLTLVTLLLDLSTATDPVRSEVLAAARSFTTTLHQRLTGRVRISIRYFAGSSGSVEAVRHTLLAEETLAAIDALEALEVTVPTGVNLHGALDSARSALASERSALATRHAGGALATQHIVVFTNGRDTASELTEEDLVQIMASSRVHTLAVGLPGANYSGSKLAALAPSGLFEASTTDALEVAFGAAANRIVGQHEGTYHLAYCTPKITGGHEVHVGVAGAELRSAAAWTFLAPGPAAGCSAAAFEAACDDRACGGFACGACDEREERCHGASGTCRSLCGTQNQCGEEPFTNLNGYVQICADTLTATRCVPDATCTNLVTDRHHCGECLNPCAASCYEAACMMVMALSLGGRHTCARADSDRLWCWGANNHYQLGSIHSALGLPALTPIAASGYIIALGGDHTCFVHGAGVVSCRGRNHQGQLGRGTTTTSSSIIEAVAGLGEVTALSAGGNTTCAQTAEGELWCWGENTYGQLGDGSTTRRTTPVLVSGVINPVKVHAGGETTCAITDDHQLLCWGRNTSGQLGAGLTASSRTTPVAVLGLAQVDDLAVGGTFACAVTGGQVWCWGRNQYRQLGDGTTVSFRNAPVAVVGLPPGGATAVAAGTAHACALTNDQKVWCWGRNVGASNPSSEDPLAPYEVPGLSGVVELQAGGDAACARQATGEVLCWGANTDGRLGNGTFTSTATPTLVVWL